MDFVILIVSSILAILLTIFIQIKYNVTKKRAKQYFLPYPFKYIIYPNCFQTITLQTPDIKNIGYLITTMTFAKNFDPINYLYVKQDEFVTLTLFLTNFFPNFYIWSKKYCFYHVGSNFSQKYKLNSTKTYNMYGCVTKKMENIIKTAKPLYAYCSYLPHILENVKESYDPLTGSVVEIKFKLEDYNMDAVKEIIEFFENCEFEKEKKYKKTMKDFVLWNNKQKIKKNMSFWDKLLIKAREYNK